MNKFFYRFLFGEERPKTIRIKESTNIWTGERSASNYRLMSDVLRPSELENIKEKLIIIDERDAQRNH